MKDDGLETGCFDVPRATLQLQLVLRNPPLDAFVLLPQIFCITALARATDPNGRAHDFVQHAHAEFPCHDARGVPTTENIMRVIHTISEVLAALYQPSALVSAESNCNPVRRLLRNLRVLISTETLGIHNKYTTVFEHHQQIN